MANTRCEGRAAPGAPGPPSRSRRLESRVAPRPASPSPPAAATAPRAGWRWARRPSTPSRCPRLCRNPCLLRAPRPPRSHALPRPFRLLRAAPRRSRPPRASPRPTALDHRRRRERTRGAPHARRLGQKHPRPMPHREHPVLLQAMGRPPPDVRRSSPRRSHMGPDALPVTAIACSPAVLIHAQAPTTIPAQTPLRTCGDNFPSSRLADASNRVHYRSRYIDHQNQ